MTTLSIYLNFNGNCEEAFTFYKSVFGGEYATLSRFSEMPPQATQEPIPESLGNKIMHVSLPISKETMLMGSDVGGEWAKGFVAGNNFTISVNANKKEEVNRIFVTLATQGKVTMLLADTFWGSYFGMLTDKFGINWMVNCALESKENKNL